MSDITETAIAHPPSGKQVDEKAAAFPPSITSVNSDPAIEKSLLRKLDLKILPIVTLLYLLSFLDRSNIGNAKLDGLTTDIGMSGDAYLWTLTLYFIGYVIFEVPSNIVLKKTSPRIWLPLIMFIWGIVSVLMGLVSSGAGLLAARFFLGVTEAGLFPGVVYYLSRWYQREERVYRVSLFFSAAATAGAFGGILAYGIGKMHGVGGKAGWSWIFIIEGLLTIVVSVLAPIWLVNYPDTATFLSEDEKRLLTARLASDSDAVAQESFSWDGVRQAFKDPAVYLYGVNFMGMSLPLYTLSLFLPTIIKDLGYTAAQAQLLTVPPYAIASVLTLVIAALSFRVSSRAPFIIGSAAVAIVGYIILLASHTPGVQYFGTIVAAAGIYPATAIVLSWPSMNVSGQVKRATACAMQITIGNTGAIIGTQMYRPSGSPRFYLGHGMAVGYLVIAIISVAVVWWWCLKENRGKADGRRDYLLQGFAKDERGAVEARRVLGDRHPAWGFKT
ncbi:hypothetical protein YB2330_003199 [Saitoella coloradoensis]